MRCAKRRARTDDELAVNPMLSIASPGTTWGGALDPARKRALKEPPEEEEERDRAEERIRERELVEQDH